MTSRMNRCGMIFDMISAGGLMNNQSNHEFDIPLSEKIKSIPGIFGIHLEERPTYDIMRTEGTFEVRCYPPQKIISIEITDPKNERLKKEALSALVNYIFGRNESSQRMAMTSPVMQEGNILFLILPRHYASKTAPLPLDERLSVKDIPMRVVASILYHGNHSEQKVQEHTTELKNWIKKHPWYIMVGNAQLAQYDGPLTLPFLRKNEIHVEVKNMH